MNITLRDILLAMTVLIGAGCQDGKQSSSDAASDDTSSIDVRMTAARCSGVAFPLEGAVPDSDRDKLCAAVRTAVAAMAEGRGAPEFNPRDTARIVGARVSYFAFRDTAERALAPYWSVDLRFARNEVGATVQISDSGIVSVVRTRE